MDRGYCTAFVTIAVLVSALVTGVTVGTGVATADEGDTLLGDVLEGDTSEKVGDGLKATWAGLGGARDRAGWLANKWVVSKVLDLEPQTASEEAEGLASYYNANNGTLESYANARGNWTANETVEITIHMDDETATRYLVANVSDGNISTSKMVKSTSRTPTQELELCEYAADQATEELRYFNENFASENKDVDAEYLGRMRGKFGDDVETTLYNSSGDCGGD